MKAKKGKAMNNKKYYRDLKKYRNTCNRQKRRYYGKSAVYDRHSWTSEEDDAILKHSIPDSELSPKIGHSVMAIQIRRSRLKKRKDKT